MIARVIEFSARNPFLIVVLIVAILGGGIWAVFATPLDAIPDLSDVQVIVYTRWEDRSPDVVEDQVTYPIVTQLLSAPRVKVVRASSFFGFSLVYVLFEDGTDLYWARSRVLEYLSGMAGKLPADATPQLGPDATGVGWGLEYVLIDRTGQHSLAELRSLQDWNVQYQLRAVPGVAEVAPVGAFVRQYQVTLDPDKLLAYRIPVNRVVGRLRQNNQEVGGRVVEFTGREYVVRGRGYFKGGVRGPVWPVPAAWGPGLFGVIAGLPSLRQGFEVRSPLDDIAEVSLGAQPDGTPIRVRDVGAVQLGPDIRRGTVDYNGEGDAAGGIVVIRFGEDAHGVLRRVKRAIEETVRPSLPPGVELVVTYDRTPLIEHAVATLREKLIEESLIVSLVCFVFLFHFRSALVAVVTLPLAVLLALLAMWGIGLTSNIMSLGGIAIAIGAMVDAAIVMIENAHKHIEHEEAKPPDQRLDMLATGIRTPIGVKVFGPDLAEVSRLGKGIEDAANRVRGTRSAFAERVAEGYFLDFDVRRPALARYGLTVADVQEVIQSAVGGANVTTTIEGRERYPVNVRYARDFRSSLDQLRRVLVETPTGAQVPMDELADVRLVSGPNMIKSEAAQLVGYVYIDFAGRDTGSYVADLQVMVGQMVQVPPGYHLEWSGSYQAMQRAGRRLAYVIPVTLLVIFVLLYLNTALAKVLIVFLAVPFSLVGAFLLLYLLGYHLSVAVWVGIIALAGVDAETGVVMLLYLDVAHERRRREGRMNNLEDLEAGVLEGAVERVRPKMMTVLAILMGLLPIMWSSGTGADVMKRIAAPMVGGIVTSFLLELLIYPAIYTIWKWWAEVRPATRRDSAS